MALDPIKRPEHERRAQASKPPAQRLADRAAHYLVVAVAAGFLTFAYWAFVAHQPVLFALTLAVTAIVIACLDALGLATPTAIMVATDIGARRGILLKEGQSPDGRGGGQRFGHRPR